MSSFYKQILRREPDPGGLETLLAEFSGPDWVDQVLNAILESDERRLNARNDALRAMVGPRPGTIVGLGSSCLMASLLGCAGWRTESYPFDWIFSDWPTIIDILETDFRDFLNPGFYLPNPANTGADRVAHQIYGMQPAMFQHHNVHLPEGHAYLTRCVERLRALRGKRVVFAAAFHADRFNDEVCQNMASALLKYFGPQIIVLGFAIDKAANAPLPTIAERWNEGANRVFHFRPVSAWTHTRFDDPMDDVALLRTVREFGAFGS
ncbi:hypothetical protein N182_32925 [Sinorhizobium sp. GL2]|nr:hypothetical protein N182_32925 [Sinorhizobium sp. GL2]